MLWGKLDDLKSAQIIRIKCEFTVFVRNIFAFTVLPVVFEKAGRREHYPKSDADFTSTT